MPVLDAFPRVTGSPWPQASPHYPLGMPPVVREIPWEEQVDFSLHVLARYHLTELFYPPVAKLYSVGYPGLAEVGNRVFAELFNDRLFSKFLNPVLDAADRAVFKDFLDQPGTLFKVDFTPIGDVRPLPGIYATPTVTLFSRHANGELLPLAIQINGLLLTPGDGSAWELAKYFVLNGAACLTITGVHALLHFPMDCINAVTKSILPGDHVLSKLLRPHLRFSLMLNHTVLEHPRTLIDNDQRESYTPFLGTSEGLRGLISAVYAGVPGNSSYPAYRFPGRPPRIHSPFGSAIEAYFECLLGFVRQVLATLPPGDPDVTAWATHLHEWLPGFPSGEEIWEGEALASTVAFVICDVSVMHAADHHDLARIPLDMVPLRLRMPPPDSPDLPAFDRKQLVTRDDTFRHAMAHELFVRPHNITLLHEVDYRFGDPALYQLNCHFLADLQDVDAQLAGSKFIPLGEIACSIQY